MKHRTKLRAKMSLEELTRGTTQLLSTSKESRRKMAEDGKRKMDADHKRREAKRLKDMDKKEGNGAVLPPK